MIIIVIRWNMIGRQPKKAKLNADQAVFSGVNKVPRWRRFPRDFFRLPMFDVLNFKRKGKIKMGREREPKIYNRINSGIPK